MTHQNQFVLLFSCQDRQGIVHEISGVIASNNSNIEESAQYRDPESNLFSMRIHFSSPLSRQAMTAAFQPAGDKLAMDWQLFDLAEPARVLVMMSKYDHCILDLLYKRRTDGLPIEICAIVSNHLDFEARAEQFGIPYHHLPVTPDNKPQQEAQLLTLTQQYQTDFVVLARYMQVLSDDLCQKLKGRVINIHHSFLPGFKGARPYHQAYHRGVKLIGATAHYVTADLDEGPIIEQDVARVTHAYSPAQLAAVGRDIERRVLSRAVRFHAEHRVVLIGNKTIVFAQ